MRNVNYDRLHAYKLEIQEHMETCKTLLEDTQKFVTDDYQALTVRTTAKLEAILSMFAAELLGLNTQVEEEVNSYYIPPTP